MRTVVVYGPQASGKTRHAEAMRITFGCKRIVDDWDGKSPLRSGDLALTNVAPPYSRVDADVVPIGEALGNLR